MKISMLGLNNYDPSVWDNFSVPQGVNADDVKNYIMLETCDLELLYPDIDVMKNAIGMWCRHELPIWTKLYITETTSYDPLYNVNITETENRGMKDDTERSSESSAESSSTAQNTDKSNAFNSPTLVDTDKQESSSNSDTSGEYTETANRSVAENVTRRRYGVDGLSVQDLIKEEREIAEFCIEDYILRSFKKRFCILVY